MLNFGYWAGKTAEQVARRFSFRLEGAGQNVDIPVTPRMKPLRETPRPATLLVGPF